MKDFIISLKNIYFLSGKLFRYTITIWILSYHISKKNKIKIQISSCQYIVIEQKLLHLFLLGKVSCIL